MSKERLEEIKEEVESLRGDMSVTSIETEVSADTILDDMEWLIEQAERVQELEDIIYQDERQAVLERMYEQNKRYQEALEFYSNRINHQIFIENGKSNIEHDGGVIARKALEE